MPETARDTCASHAKHLEFGLAVLAHVLLEPLVRGCLLHFFDIVRAIGGAHTTFPCSQLHTRTQKSMNRGDVEILFGTSLDRLITSTTARPNTGETDAEFLAAAGLFTTEVATDVAPQGSSTDSESSELSAHHRIRNVCKDVLSVDV